MDLKYKRMIHIMKERYGRKRPREKWFVYMLLCEGGTFYTGITKDLEKRIEKHNAGKAAKYTRTRRPVKLIYQEICNNRSKALVRECQVKALPKKKKQELIENKGRIKKKNKKKNK